MADDPKPPLSVVIPVYNEATAVEGVIARLRTVLATAGLETAEIIAVDDGSIDGSGERLRRLEGVRAVRHSENRGYGASLKSGIAAAQSDCLLIIDADGTYPPEAVPDLMRRLEPGVDMVVGSRRGSEAIPLARRPAKWLLGRMASYLTGREIPDINSGLRLFRRDLYRRHRFLLPDGFSFTTTITMAAFSGGSRVLYLPIAYRPRIGRSKIRPLRDTLDFFGLILRTAVWFNPMKVFLPAGLGLTLIGLVWGLVSAAALRNVSTVPALFIISGIQILALGLLADLIQKKIHGPSA